MKRVGPNQFLFTRAKGNRSRLTDIVGIGMIAFAVLMALRGCDDPAATSPPAQAPVSSVAPS